MIKRNQAKAPALKPEDQDNPAQKNVPFSLTGTFLRGSQAAPKKQSIQAPAAAGKFGGSSSRCTVCGKIVYEMEKLKLDNIVIHKMCLKCSDCNMKLASSTYFVLDSKFYCKNHYTERHMPVPVAVINSSTGAKVPSGPGAGTEAANQPAAAQPKRLAMFVPVTKEAPANFLGASAKEEQRPLIEEPAKTLPDVRILRKAFEEKPPQAGPAKTTSSKRVFKRPSSSQDLDVKKAVPIVEQVEVKLVHDELKPEETLEIETVSVEHVETTLAVKTSKKKADPEPEAHHKDEHSSEEENDSGEFVLSSVKDRTVDDIEKRVHAAMKQDKDTKVEDKPTIKEEDQDSLEEEEQKIAVALEQEKHVQETHDRELDDAEKKISKELPYREVAIVTTTTTTTTTTSEIASPEPAIHVSQDSSHEELSLEKHEEIQKVAASVTRSWFEDLPSAEHADKAEVPAKTEATGHLTGSWFGVLPGSQAAASEAPKEDTKASKADKKLKYEEKKKQKEKRDKIREKEKEHEKKEKEKKEKEKKENEKKEKERKEKEKKEKEKRDKEKREKDKREKEKKEKEKREREKREKEKANKEETKQKAHVKSRSTVTDVRTSSKRNQEKEGKESPRSKKRTKEPVSMFLGRSKKEPDSRSKRHSQGPEKVPSKEKDKDTHQRRRSEMPSSSKVDKVRSSVKKSTSGKKDQDKDKDGRKRSSTYQTDTKKGDDKNKKHESKRSNMTGSKKDKAKEEDSD